MDKDQALWGQRHSLTGSYQGSKFWRSTWYWHTSRNSPPLIWDRLNSRHSSEESEKCALCCCGGIGRRRGLPNLGFAGMWVQIPPATRPLYHIFIRFGEYQSFWLEFQPSPFSGFNAQIPIIPVKVLADLLHIRSQLFIGKSILHIHQILHCCLFRNSILL